MCGSAGRVRPGDRLVLVAKAVQTPSPTHHVRLSSDSLGPNMVFHGKIIGVPIMSQAETAQPG